MNIASLKSLTESVFSMDSLFVGKKQSRLFLYIKPCGLDLLWNSGEIIFGLNSYDFLFNKGLISVSERNILISSARSGQTFKIQAKELNLNEKLDVLIELEEYAKNTRQEVIDVLGNKLIIKFESSGFTGAHPGRFTPMLFRKHLEANGDTGVIEISSGSVGISCAIVSSIIGSKLKLVVPDSKFPVRHSLAQRFGADLYLGNRKLGIDGANALLKRLIVQEERLQSNLGHLNHSQRHDTLPYMAEISNEVTNKCGSIDYYFGAMGNGTTIRGIGERIRLLNPQAKVIGVRYNNHDSKEVLMPGNDRLNIPFPHHKEFEPDELMEIDLLSAEDYAKNNELGLTSAIVRMAFEKYVSKQGIKGKKCLVLNYDNQARY